MEETSKSDDMLAVQTKLPRDLAKKFLAECEAEDRDMSSMARLIIRQYFAQRDLEKEVEKFKQLQKSQSAPIPHFSGGTPGLQNDVVG